MRPKGIALVATLAILVMIAALAFGTFFTTQTEMFTTRNDVTSLQANYVAEAGLQKYKAALFQNYRWVESQNSGGSSGGSSAGSTACQSSVGNGIDFDRDGRATQFVNNKITLTKEDVTDTAGTVIGSYTVSITRDTATPQFYTLESVGTSSGATAKVRMVVQMANTGLLDNAIFAGQGQANKFMNGNTSIRGGIYVVGTSPTTPVIISNGNFQMLNSYDIRGNDYGDAARLGMDDANEAASDLCASLRVQYGQVDISGSSQIGTSSTPLKGVYVGRGASDIINNPNSSTGCPIEKRYLCTDNGPSAFDLSNPPSFPTFGSTGCDPANPSRTWRQCINTDSGDTSKGLRIRYVSGGNPIIVNANGTTNTSLTLPSSCRTALSGAVASTSSSGNGKGKNNTSGTEADTRDIWLGPSGSGGDSNVDCRVTVGGRTVGWRYDATGNSGRGSFEVYGDVQLEGFNLRIYSSVEYTARSWDDSGATVQNSTLVVSKINDSDTEGGNIKIEGNFIPNGDGGSRRFPHHVLGLVAQEDFFQQGNNIMAPIYAGDTFYTGQKRVLFGSVVSNYFCTTDAGTSGNVADYTGCNAGQGSEVIYINTGTNKPGIMQRPEQAIQPVFKILSYERL